MVFLSTRLRANIRISAATRIHTYDIGRERLPISSGLP